MKLILFVLFMFVITITIQTSYAQPESFYKVVHYGVSMTDRSDTLNITYFDNRIIGNILYDEETIDFDIPVQLNSDSFKARGDGFIIIGKDLMKQNNMNVIFTGEQKKKVEFFMRMQGEPVLFTEIKTPTHLLEKNRIQEDTETLEELLDRVAEEMKEFNKVNAPIGNYSNNVIEEAKSEIVDHFYLSVDVPDRFTNDHSNQLEAYVYNRGTKLTDIPITFELVKNGIVEATTTETTIDEVGARGVWKLNELLTPAGCYEYVVSAVVNGEELKQTEKVQVIREVGMSHETMEELHTCETN